MPYSKDPIAFMYSIIHPIFYFVKSEFFAELKFFADLKFRLTVF